MKQALRFGGIAGVIIIIYTFVIFFAMGSFEDMSFERLALVETLGYLRYLILFAVIIFALRVIKKGTTPPLSYWQLVKQGVLTALVVAVCVGLMEVAYILINPDFMEQYGQLQLQKMKSEGATLEEVIEFKSEMKRFSFMAKPLPMGVFYFFETAILGSVASFIIALFFRSTKGSINLTEV